MPEPGEDALVLHSAPDRHGEPAVALVPVPGPAGGVWLRPQWRYDGDAWEPLAEPGRWSPSDLHSALAWFTAVRDGAAPHGDALWAGSPAVGFHLIERDDDEGTVAICVCVMEQHDAAWPTLHETWADPVEDDERYTYITSDTTLASVRTAVKRLAQWHRESGSTAVQPG